MNKMEIEAPPPVPPRRRKHKSDVVPTKPSTAPRNNKKGHQDNSKSNSVKLKSGDLRLNSKPLTDVFTDTTKNQRFDVSEMITIDAPSKFSIADEPKNLRADQNLEYCNENRYDRSSPLSSKCSPLLFTLQDFESVMSHSGLSDGGFNERYESIITPDTSGSTSISSFIENLLINEEEEDEQACFRVTTTNVPFEKCAGGWSLSIDNKDFDEKFDEPDHYIFTDYMDRNKRWNAACFFDDDTFHLFGRDAGAGSMRRSAAKVRFVIESPSSSISDSDLDDTCDSFGNIESIIADDGSIDENHRTSVIITEITETNQPIEGNENSHECPRSDQFGDASCSFILDSDINTIRNLDYGHDVNVDSLTYLELAPGVANNKEEAANYDEPKAAEWPESVERRNYENHHPLSSIHLPHFMSPKKPNFDAIPNIHDDLMPTLPITYDPCDQGFIRKYWDVESYDFNGETHANNQSSRKEPPCRTSSEGSKTARQTFLKGKLKADSNENENLNSAIDEDSRKKGAMADKPRIAQKKIFIDSALCDFVDDGLDIEWNESSDNEGDGGKLHSATNDNDHKFIEIDAARLLNRDTYLAKEVSISKHPTSLTLNDNENNNKKLPNKEEFNFGSGLTGLSQQQYLVNTLTVSTESKDDVNWVPVSVRRNSFLGNMLTEDKTGGRLERNVPCSIIAAHLKPMFPQAVVCSLVPSITRDTIVEGTSVFRNVDKSRDAGTIGIVRSGSGELLQNQLGNETGIKVIGSMPASQERLPSGYEIEKKSTSEAKSDVLSELLCNFGTIKLKPVEPYAREIDWMEMDDKPAIEIEIGDKRRKKEVESVGRNKTEHVRGLEMCSNETKVEEEVVKSVVSRSIQVSMTKTSTTMTKRVEIEDSSLKDNANRDRENADDHTSLRRIDDKSAIVVLECTEDREGMRWNHVGANSITLDTDIIRMTVGQQVVSIDKCAIARKSNTVIRRNNNDNNAMTPVAVCNDQKFCDADVTIVPGSVRNFVELYEIQCDQTSKNSKSNYNAPVKRAMTRCRKGLPINAEIDAEEKMMLGDKNVEMLKGANGDENGTDETEAQASSQIKLQQSCGDRPDQGQNDNVRYNVITRNIVVQDGKASHARDGFSSTNDSTYMQQRQQQLSSSDPVAAKRRSQEDCFNITTELSPRSELKKPVKFYSNCEIISSNYDEGATPNTKWKAPERPSIIRRTEERDCATKSITECNRVTKPIPIGFIRAGDTMTPTSTRRSDASLTRTQIQPGVEDNKNNTIKSGITPSVPKSDISHPRQSYVFQCRV